MITTTAKQAVEVWNIGLDFAAQVISGEAPVSGFVNVTSGTGTATFDSISGTVATVTFSGGTAGARTILQIGITTNTNEVLAEYVQIPVI